ncbi:MAG: gamma-glutamylcyclotransferase family protein [Acidobacteriota bacterium]
MAERSQAPLLPDHLFVYGTLRPGQSAFETFCREALTIDPAVASGSLYVVPAGYPILVLPETPGGTPQSRGPGTVIGDVLSFPDLDVRLAEIDAYECVDSRSVLPTLSTIALPASAPEAACGNDEYLRTIIEVRLLHSRRVMNAWAYACPPLRMGEVKRSGRLIAGGDWNDR